MNQARSPQPVFPSSAAAHPATPQGGHVATAQPQISQTPQTPERESSETLRNGASLSQQDLEDGYEDIVYHPLRYTWLFWTNKDKTDKNFQNYGDSNIAFGKVTTVEEFWGCYNSMPEASKLPAKSSLQFFKEGIKPIWEDRSNENVSLLFFLFLFSFLQNFPNSFLPPKKQGSEWVISCKKDFELTKYWKELLLSLIGQSLDKDDKLCGVGE